VMAATSKTKARREYCEFIASHCNELLRKE
jgi:hypothetical protein